MFIQQIYVLNILNMLNILRSFVRSKCYTTITLKLTSYPLQQSDYCRPSQSDVVCCLLRFGVTQSSELWYDRNNSFITYKLYPATRCCGSVPSHPFPSHIWKVLEIFSGSTASSPDIHVPMYVKNTRVLKWNVVWGFESIWWRTVGDCLRPHRFPASNATVTSVV
jgi:hypothetical protein